MSKRHHRDDLSDIEEDTYAMLGSRFSKIAAYGDERDHDRRRHADSDSDYRGSVRGSIRKSKRQRDRINTH